MFKFPPKKTPEPKTPKAPKSEPAAVTPVKAGAPSAGGKSSLLSGLMFIGAAFVFSLVIVYFLVDMQKGHAVEMAVLQQQLNAVNLEKEFIDHKAAELEDSVGQSIYLDRIVARAEEIYDDNEKTRRSGYLWIDRKTSVCLVTLGAVNGVGAGSQLKVYDGDKEVGLVRVETPLDVISYAKPVKKELDQFERDYYRVVFED